MHGYNYSLHVTSRTPERFPLTWSIRPVLFLTSSRPRNISYHGNVKQEDTLIDRKPDYVGYGRVNKQATGTKEHTVYFSLRS